MIKNLLLSIAMVLLIPAYSLAYTECLFQWDANTEPDIAGYRAFNVNSPTVPTFDVTHPTTSQTVPAAQCAIGDEFYMVAYDNVGNVSAESNHVIVLDTEAPFAPTGFDVIIQ